MQIAICVISFIANFIMLLLAVKVNVGSCTIGDAILAFLFSLLSLTSLTPIPLIMAAIIAFIPTIAALIAIAIFKLEDSKFFDKELF